MRILQVIPGKIWGGAEQYIVDLGSGLKIRGHEIIYACYDIESVTSRLKSWVNEFTVFPNFDIGYYRFIRILKELVRDVDIVHIHDTSFIEPVSKALAKVNSNARIILTRHVSHRQPVGYFFRKSYAKLSSMICVSDFVRCQWLSSNRWFPEYKCRVVLNSIPDTHSNYGESIRSKYNIPADDALLMFCGRIRRSKGCDLLLDALAKVKKLNWHLVFIGSCHPKDYSIHLKNKAKSMNFADKVHFYGFTRFSRDMMWQANIGVSPSLVKDSCPLTNLEFMQRGVCVVTSSSGGQPECMVNGDSGFIVSPNDADALAATLQTLLDNQELRTRIGRNGQKYFEDNLSYQKFLNRIENVYLEAFIEG